MWHEDVSHVHSNLDMSPLFIEHLDIVTQKFKTKFH